jgi:hypothetical protein
MMDLSLFLLVNDQPISLGQSLKYLESAGKLELVIWEIIRQYALEQELQALEENQISTELINK